MQFQGMTSYRRVKCKGGTYFFTVALERRGSDLLTREIDLLRSAFVATWRASPFHCDAFVVLPDHLHAVWTLPAGDADYGRRWGAIKGRFTRAVRAKMGCNPILRSNSKLVKGDGGIWQRRFWEHHIRDARDYENHVRYCWLNPVKHGLCERATDWPYSSIHRDIRMGRVDTQVSGKIPEGTFGE